jgi:hypothetical protein
MALDLVTSLLIKADASGLKAALADARNQVAGFGATMGEAGDAASGLAQATAKTGDAAREAGAAALGLAQATAKTGDAARGATSSISAAGDAAAKAGANMRKAGSDASAINMDGFAKAMTQAGKAMGDVQAQMAKLRAEVDPLNTKLAQNADKLDQVRRLTAAGVIDTKASAEWTRNLGLEHDSLVKQLDKSAEAHGHVTGASSKMREGMVLFHEFLRGDWKRGLGSATIELQNFGLMGLVFNPITLSAIALAGAIGLVGYTAIEMSSRTRGFEVALKGMGRQAEITTAQVEGVYQALRHQGVDAQQSQAISVDLIRSRLPKNAIDQIQGVGADLGAATGVGTEKAFQALIDVYKNGFPALQKFNQETGFLRVNQYQAAIAAREHGDKLAVFNVLVEASAKQAGQFRQAEGEIKGTIDEVKVAFGDFLETLAKTQKVQDAIHSLAQGLTAIAAAIKDPSWKNWGDILSGPVSFGLRRGGLNTSLGPSLSANLGSIPSYASLLGDQYQRAWNQNPANIPISSPIPISAPAAPATPDFKTPPLLPSLDDKALERLTEGETVTKRLIKDNDELAGKSPGQAAIIKAGQDAYNQSLKEHSDILEAIPAKNDAIKRAQSNQMLAASGGMAKQIFDLKQLALVSDAYGQSTARGIVAEAARKGALENFTNAAVNPAVAAQNALAEAIGQELLKGNQQIQSMGLRVASAQAMAAASRLGYSEEAKAALQNEINNATLAARNALSAELIAHRGQETEASKRLREQIEKLTQAVRDEARAQLETAEQRFKRGQDEQLQVANLTLEITKQNSLILDPAVKIANELKLQHLVDELRINRELASSTAEVRAARLAEADAIAKVNAQTKLVQAQERPLAEAFSNAAREAQSAFAGAFEKILSGGIKSFGDLTSIVKDLLIKLAAQAATLMVFHPTAVFNEIGSWGSTAAGALGPGASAASGATVDAKGNPVQNASGLLGIFSNIGKGLSGIWSAITNPGSLFGSAAAGIDAFGAATFGTTASVAGTTLPAGTGILAGSGGVQIAGVSGGATSLSGILGAAGIGALGGLAANVLGIAKNPYGGLGGAAAGGLAAILGAGSLAGPIGLAVGLIASLFGPGAPHMAGSQNFEADGNNLTVGNPLGRIDTSGLASTMKGLNTGITQIITALGGSLSLNGITRSSNDPRPTYGFLGAEQQSDGTTLYHVGIGKEGPGGQWSSFDQNGIAQADVAAIVTRETLKYLISSGQTTGLSDTTQQIVKSSKFGGETDLNQIQSDLEFAGTYDEIIKLARGTDTYGKQASQTSQALDSLDKYFADATKQATDLGLATDEFAKAAETAKKTLGTNYIQGLQDQIDALSGKGFLKSLRDFSTQAQGQFDDLQKLLDKGAIDQGQFDSGSKLATALQQQEAAGILLGLTKGQLDQVITAFADDSSVFGKAVEDMAKKLKAGGEALTGTGIDADIFSEKIMQPLLTRELNAQSVLDPTKKAANDAAIAQAARAVELRTALAAAAGQGATQSQLDWLKETYKTIYAYEDQAAAAQKAQAAMASATSTMTNLGVTIDNYLNQSQVDQYSGKSPLEILNATKQQFQDQLALASGGNEAALNSITSYAQQYREAISSYYGTGTDAAGLNQGIFDALKTLKSDPSIQGKLAQSKLNAQGDSNITIGADGTIYVNGQKLGTAQSPNALTTPNISAFKALANTWHDDISADQYSQLASARDAVLGTYNTDQLKAVSSTYYGGQAVTGLSDFLGFLHGLDQTFLGTRNPSADGGYDGGSSGSRQKASGSPSLPDAIGGLQAQLHNDLVAGSGIKPVLDAIALNIANDNLIWTKLEPEIASANDRHLTLLAAFKTDVNTGFTGALAAFDKMAAAADAVTKMAAQFQQLAELMQALKAAQDQQNALLAQYGNADLEASQAALAAINDLASGVKAAANNPNVKAA